jgi:hypothetical protein
MKSRPTTKSGAGTQLLWSFFEILMSIQVHRGVVPPRRNDNLHARVPITKDEITNALLDHLNHDFASWKRLASWYNFILCNPAIEYQETCLVHLVCLHPRTLPVHPPKRLSYTSWYTRGHDNVRGSPSRYCLGRTQCSNPLKRSSLLVICRDSGRPWLIPSSRARYCS